MKKKAFFASLLVCCFLFQARDNDDNEMKLPDPIKVALTANETKVAVDVIHQESVLNYLENEQLSAMLNL